MPGYTLKVKTKRGQHVLNTLDAESSVVDLKRTLSALTEIPETNLYILSGFPPKPLDISNESSTIKTVGIVSGDTLILEDKAGASLSTNAKLRDQEASDEEFAKSLAAVEDSEFNGILMKKVVPADNSCLFTSIGKDQKSPSRGVRMELRALTQIPSRLRSEWHSGHGRGVLYAAGYCTACSE